MMTGWVQVAQYSCLTNLLVVADLRDKWPDKFSAYSWAVQHLVSLGKLSVVYLPLAEVWPCVQLPRCSTTLVWNANMYPNADVGQEALMSVDYPVSQRAFIMNLCPLVSCSLDIPECGPTSTRVGTPREAALFGSIVMSRADLVSVWGWGGEPRGQIGVGMFRVLTAVCPHFILPTSSSDPEHAYTNLTTASGGAVFCTFSTPNLAFWAALGTALGSTGLRLPAGDLGRPLDNDAAYLIFETNEVVYMAVHNGQLNLA